MGNMNYDAEITGSHMAGYGSGFGGGGILILLIIVVVALLFRGHGFGGGHGEGGHGGRTWFPDESNWQQSYQLEKQIQHEGAATRSLIEKNYIEAIRDDRDRYREDLLIAKNQIFMEKQFGLVDHRLDRMECEMLKRPPVFGLANTVEMQPCGGAPRRGGCPDFV